MKLEKYYENLEILHVNTQPYRSYYIPRNKNLDYRCKYLNSSDWYFQFYNSVYEVPENFTEEIIDNGDIINVPSCLNMFGYDKHLYANVKGPIPFIPPYVPDQNPTGAYVKTFEMSKDDKTFKNFLVFDGVDSAFFVWLNGEFVGYSQVAHATSEFDISSFTKIGLNILSVIVLKYSDGTFLEDQDKFRMFGIFRDVYIINRPKNFIRDFKVEYQVSDDFKSVDVHLDFMWLNKPEDVTIELLYKNKSIYKGQDADFKLGNAHLWNAEQPNLYTLNLITNTEIIQTEIGFKRVEIINSILYINGQKIKIKGTNRHDSNAYTGATISREQLMDDLRLMKENNINAIRTSHYPSSPWAYELYSRYGFYVMTEADLESHNTCEIYGGGHLYNSTETLVDDYTFGMLCHDPKFYEAMLDRIQASVIREKNSPCVFMYSLGNESGYGPNLEKCAKWIKEYDKTALIHYESSVYQKVGYNNNLSNIDVYSRMYISPDDVIDYCSNNTLHKPIILCEYSHAMGNSNGDLEKYYQTMLKYDNFIGGFIWEWNDHAIYMGKDINGKDKYYYGGDFNDFPNAGNFCLDGLLHPSRKPKTNLLEFKNVHRPIRAYLRDGKIYVSNQQNFLNILDSHVIIVTQYIDNEEVKAEKFDYLDVEPGGVQELEFTFTEHKSVDNYLIIEYFTKKASELLPKYYEAGFDQIMLNKVEVKVSKSLGGKKVTISETETKLKISNDTFTAVFDKLGCTLEKFVKENISYLEKPVDYNIFRAPTDNDRKVITQWKQAGYNRTQIKMLNTTCLEEKNRTVVEFDFYITAVFLQAIMKVKAIYTFTNKGDLTVTLHAAKDPVFPELPRFGVRFYLDKSFQNINYKAFGPYETYADKHHYCYYSEFEDMVKNMYEDYIVPQEHGSRYGARYLKMMNQEQRVEITAKDFSFNVSNYTQEQLFKTTHNFKLKEEDFVTVCIDYKNAGIGSSSCGQAKLNREYAIIENQIDFEFEVYFNTQE
ncbi:MAG: hypothetical protein ATN31_07155 [Candidatus Epulonipiscioides saccharophilum]|nr:MAG: hypothetical protein ATN31_07155 [Epulopiscium sp. AS2M-Bin001]